MFSDQATLFYRFGVALFIGILIGLEREHAAEDRDKQLFAGVRTFALLALVGCTSALLSHILQSPWPLVVVFLGLSILLGVAYFVLSRSGDIGGTTEVAAVLTFLCGALAYWEYLALSTAIAVTATVLLSLKRTMHDFAQQIGAEDVYATLKFATIAAIVLPVLPNQSFGPPPFDALNPYRIWLMVVFISGISFAGYVLMQLINPSRGIGLTGLLGGLVSSTAVTLGFTQRSREVRSLAGPFALAITLAWAVMFVRVIGQLAVLNPTLLQDVWLPLAAAALALVAYSGLLYWRRPGDDGEEVDLANPFQLRPALTFGALYAFVLLISRAGEIYFGRSGIYVSSILAGLADVNAITISMAELSGKSGDIEIQTASTAVILAVISNTVVKTILVMAGGSARMRRMIVPSAIIAISVTGVTAFIV